MTLDEGFDSVAIEMQKISRSSRENSPQVFQNHFYSQLNPHLIENYDSCSKNRFMENSNPLH